MSKTREQFPLSHKKVIKKTIISIFGWIIIFIVVEIFAGVVLVPMENLFGHILGLGLVITTVVSLLLLALIFGISYYYQTLYFNSYFYDLTSDYIVIKKGVITPREITIPYERIQDVYVDQDMVDRMFGLFDVHLSSATVSSGMEAHIDGVEKPAADGLRSLLLQTVSSRISKSKGQAVLPSIPAQPSS